ncbi:restriction endonuclease [Sporosarcina sp. P20a]|uniref:HNH endonuclease n=1 Tax=Sporosarcina sp. P20a TaxID=2048256 RepID=UPI000C16E15A|nr:HNH endonuclease signature motif containing protein [Sporosarcina sp. P20a]PIC85202.1 restriction endonuclease [Sporosarcina sp. P20a]
MQSYIVMQGRTYDEEKELGVLWSLQQDSIGNVHHFWERMKEVDEGDRIFHYVKGDIVAISVAKSSYREERKPSSIRLTDSEDAKGYLVEVEYHELDKPLTIADCFDELLPLLPIKYSAFQENGNGNQGYLFPCNEELTIKLVELIADLNIYEIDEEQLEFVMGTVQKTEHDFLIPVLAETESETKTKVRMGHQRFRNELMQLWNDQCALCDIELPELLQASYAKPWKDCTNNERVDPNNGILLCRNHDALYHYGFIAFDGTGKIHISSRILEEDYEKYGLHSKMRVNRTENNKPYLKWHKKHMFKE